MIDCTYLLRQKTLNSLHALLFFASGSNLLVFCVQVISHCLIWGGNGWMVMDRRIKEEFTMSSYSHSCSKLLYLIPLAAKPLSLDYIYCYPYTLYIIHTYICIHDTRTWNTNAHEHAWYMYIYTELQLLKYFLLAAQFTVGNLACFCHMFMS